MLITNDPQESPAPGGTPQRRTDDRPAAERFVFMMVLATLVTSSLLLVAGIAQLVQAS